MCNTRLSSADEAHCSRRDSFALHITRYTLHAVCRSPFSVDLLRYRDARASPFIRAGIFTFKVVATFPTASQIRSQYPRSLSRSLRVDPHGNLTGAHRPVLTFNF